MIPYSSSMRMIFSVRSSLVMAHTPFMYFFRQGLTIFYN